MKNNYYKDQLNMLTDKSQIEIKLTDYSGNTTNNMTLNLESIKELKEFLSEHETLKEKQDMILIEDWTGKVLYKGHKGSKEVDAVLDANKCICYRHDRGCQLCDDTGYRGDFEVYWAYPELNEDRNVYEYIRYFNY